jgi:hypothetical protein
MIPKVCKNSKLLIAKGIIEADRSRFPTLVGNVISRLTRSIEAKEHGAPADKLTIANTSSTSGQHSNTHHQTRRASCMTAGKHCLVDGKMVGDIEGLHYTEDILIAMTSEQKVQVLSLCKSKSASHAVKLASTAGSRLAPMDISDQLATLMCVVQSLDSNREGKHQSLIHHNSPH